jgi:AraC family transcriptional regulator
MSYPSQALLDSHGPARQSLAHRAWPGLSAEILAVAAGRHDVPALADFRLGLHLGPAVTADCRCDGQHLRHHQAEDDLLFVPPGLPGTWQDDGDSHFLRVRLAPAVMAAAAADLGLDSARVTLAPRLHFRDPTISYAARFLLSLLTTARQPDATADLSRLDEAEAGYAGALASTLAQRLWQSSGVVPPTVTHQRGLSPRQQHRLRDHIEANLDQALPLGDLARLLGISVSHLTALFRQSHGVSPHQYILQRRLDRAVALLRDSELPISEIALATGFAHQSHLASHLRRQRAISPRDLRRQRVLS